jgi:O-antigen ligase
MVVILYWRRSVGGRIWPWLAGAVLLGLFALTLTLQIPELSARLDPRGETGIFRLNLWRSSLNMFLDHPLFGVGLDNFLYEYRGRYILDAAWKEPNLNHPHNIFLDFATRLGMLGLLAGVWLFWNYYNLARKLPKQVISAWRPVAVGLLGSFVYIIAHGFVDHSFFLTDLAYTFYFLLGLAVWLNKVKISIE